MRIYSFLLAIVLALLTQRAAAADAVRCDADSSAVQQEAHADSIFVSLLTCSPGQEVYSLYGHTAIRCWNSRGTLDVAFNYGVFSFTQPHFIWRFVLGKCDYMLEPVQFSLFLRAYARRGSRVTEQVLALNQEEATAILLYLIENSKPENCEYRYNFFYNNCTTMVRDVIERCVQGTVSYEDEGPQESLREILHTYTAEHPWAAEGDDFLLGAEVDKPASMRQKMFAPEYMMRYADGATVKAPDGSTRKLVAETRILARDREVTVEPEFFLTPRQAGWALLAVCVLVVLVEVSLKRVCTMWSAFLLLMQGLAGILLLFMFLFSEHPAVDSNWLVWPFNPFALLGIYFALCGKRHARACWWTAYFGVLTLFLLFCPLIPQDFGNIVVPLTMCLLTRPIGFYICSRRKRK